MTGGKTEPLKFKVAPHIVEDLGLNLYTSLPRVLVEFVANAYDADSAHAMISFDKAAVEKARKVIKQQHELQVAQNEMTDLNVAPLAGRTLPDDINITISDAGFGMSRDDLDRKFLVAGRRRRQLEPGANCRTPNNRLLMGRKGLGKLAGFGVGKRVIVTTRKSGESHATRITLDFDELVAKSTTHEIEVREERLDGARSGIPKSGTIVVISRLLYDPLKSRDQTIEHEIADHFALIDPKDFAITVNGVQVKQAARKYAYAWPEPKRAVNEYVKHALDVDVEGGDETEGGDPKGNGPRIEFRYRIRFRGKDEALPATQRGVRVYAHNRLAAAPSLLAADTNMHGFRMTDYLDGVVLADFIDDEETDYIATDRQSLRWDSPMLSGLHKFLSEQIREACKQYQLKRDEDAEALVEEDSFTKAEINKLTLSGRDEKMAYRFAAILERSCKRGVEDPVYRNTLPALVRGIGHGHILAAIANLAEQDHPELGKVAIEIARLTKDELDQFIGRAKTRLKAIELLKKIVEAADFKDADNEGRIQDLFEKSPWLVDPTYTQFLTADQSLDTVFVRLAKALQIGKHAKATGAEKSKRPDLVFLIGSVALGRVVIVELKSTNLHLDITHFNQLQFYMGTAQKWLAQHGHPHVRVHGQLIGSRAPESSQAPDVAVLRMQEAKDGPNSPTVVRDYVEVLTDTEAAHRELIEDHAAASKKAK